MQIDQELFDQLFIPGAPHYDFFIYTNTPDEDVLQYIKNIQVKMHEHGKYVQVQCNSPEQPPNPLKIENAFWCDDKDKGLWTAFNRGCKVCLNIKNLPRNKDEDELVEEMLKMFKVDPADVEEIENWYYDLILKC